MSSIDIQINLGDLPSQISQWQRLDGVKLGLQVAAVYLQGKLAEYPPQSSRPQPFVSDKQRRGFFAKLKAGEIEVPYRRGSSPGSERLGQSWSTDVNGMSAVVGSGVSYGPLVQGTRQAQYHEVTGWQTVEDVGQAEAANVGRIVEAQAFQGM